MFLAVGVGFIFVHLVAGKLIRPSRPDAEKATVYECGEPTIGSAWVQFDLRFYVVALLFVIFDVEVAFFFPWAEVFGKANAVANAEYPGKPATEGQPAEPGTAAQYNAYAAKILDLAVPASATDFQRREVERFRKMRTMTDEELQALLAKQEGAMVKYRAGQKLDKEEVALLGGEGPLKRREFEKNREDARQLAVLALGEIVVFFGVLLVGFAYLWRRGDLAWVRSTAAERPQPAVSTNGNGASKELTGAGAAS
jgi:NADH-quinone oxidoreductase subunit A